MTMTTERPLARLVQQKTEVPSEAADTCKAFLDAKAAKTAAEKVENRLKPQIEEIRLAIGPNTINLKETIIPGKYKGVKGEFKINPVVSDKETVSLEVLREKLHPTIFDKYIVPHINEIEVKYNLVSFSPGQG